VHDQYGDRVTHPFDLMWEVLRAMGGEVHAAAAAEDLTPMQAMLLDRLQDGIAAPMTDLAQQLHCDKSNLTGVVDALEARGLVERTTPPDDRRVRALVTTPEGRAVRARLDRRLRADNPLLARLGASQLSELERALVRMMAP
jgi:DNA-binding MarR family transcriptional regulator